MPEPGEYLTVRLHNALGDETGLQPAFLGRLLPELLLDVALAADDPSMGTFRSVAAGDNSICE